MDPTRRHIHILMSTGGEEDINLGLTNAFRHSLGDKYDLEILEVSSASKFLEQAARVHVDAFIILLNNIIPDTGDLFLCNLEDDATFPAVKVDQALQILSFLKQKYHKPVLALAAWWPDNWDISSKVDKHGLDYFGFLPVDARSLATALSGCLENLEPAKSE